MADSDSVPRDAASTEPPGDTPLPTSPRLADSPAPVDIFGELDRIMKSAADFQAFSGFLQEWGADIDLLFVAQVDQLKEVSTKMTQDPALLDDQVQRVVSKHFTSTDAPFSMSLLSPRDKKQMKDLAIQKKCGLPELSAAQTKVKFRMASKFLLGYLAQEAQLKNLRAEEEASLEKGVAVSSGGVPTLLEALHDMEVLHLFLSFLMPLGHHYMFIFWYELQQFQLFRQSQKEYSANLKLLTVKERDFLKELYRKYIVLGSKVVKEVVPPAKEGEKSTSLELLLKDDSLTDMVILHLFERCKKFSKFLRNDYWKAFIESDSFHQFQKKRRESIKTREESSAMSPTFTKKAESMTSAAIFKSSVPSSTLLMSMSSEKYSKDALLASRELRTVDYVVHIIGGLEMTGVSKTKFVSRVISRYPADDWIDFPLPEGLEYFCFPFDSNDDGNTESVSSSFGSSRCFNFIYTADRWTGFQAYCACIQFDGYVFEEKDPFRLTDTVSVICLVSRVDSLEAPTAKLRQLAQVKEKVPITATLEYKELLGDTSKLYDPRVQSQDLDSTIFFRMLHPVNIMAILEFLLFEKKVLLMSSQLSLLTLSAETLRQMLKPFSYPWRYFPILPLSFKHILSSPTPFLVGVHSSWKKEVFRLQRMNQDFYIVDLDHDCVLPPITSELSFPFPIRTRLLWDLRRASHGKLIDIDYSHRVVPEVKENCLQVILKNLEKTWNDFFLKEVGCYVTAIPESKAGKPPLIIFDANEFLRKKPKGVQKFLECFIRTKIFEYYVCSNAARSNPSFCVMGKQFLNPSFKVE